MLSEEKKNQCKDEDHHPEIAKISNRFARIIGHTKSIKKMVEDGRDCSEVLVQIAAVKSALNNVGKIILDDHIDHCVVQAVEDNNVVVNSARLLGYDSADDLKEEEIFDLDCGCR